MLKRANKARLFPADQAGALGYDVATWRKSRNMNQAELAKLLDMDESTLRKIETRKGADYIKGQLYWALVGLDTQTRRIRHYVKRLSGAMQYISGAELTLLHVAPDLDDSAHGVRIYRELPPPAYNEPVFSPEDHARWSETRADKYLADHATHAAKLENRRKRARD